jgi:hypothetical protein
MAKQSEGSKAIHRLKAAGKPITSETVQQQIRQDRSDWRRDMREIGRIGRDRS